MDQIVSDSQGLFISKFIVLVRRQEGVVFFLEYFEVFEIPHILGLAEHVFCLEIAQLLDVFGGSARKDLLELHIERLVDGQVEEGPFQVPINLEVVLLKLKLMNLALDDGLYIGVGVLLELAKGGVLVELLLLHKLEQAPELQDFEVKIITAVFELEELRVILSLGELLFIVVVSVATSVGDALVSTVENVGGSICLVLKILDIGGGFDTLEC